ncbi:glycogen debranching N-terminal domain-containing protein [Pseudarthrobacter sp. H3Y2-7]|uniref:amylo-alpha-1,6-glucosidase n=1 Tax=Pseudarthrobacter naphthalenicus TaxID=3031328 RepID=UPI0023AEC9B2|nr:glycogen debranching N-terminal domain-containing protein [Pseudarthrobacter sp. H3Y2-7]MDE8670661.1 glycogen debranching N-terminal domain-containing protein [Pseudarthrobacter sp. H3Y2-7]
MAGWGVGNSAGSAGPGALTLVQGTSFCISAPNGDMAACLPHGLFFQDTRFISEWMLKVQGLPLESLSATTPEPFHGVFVGRPRRDDHADTSLLIDRERKLGEGLLETVTVHNYSQGPMQCRVELFPDADFASLFEVKEGRQAPREHCSRRLTPEGLELESERDGHTERITVAFAGSRLEGDSLVLETTIAAHGQWSGTISAKPVLAGTGGHASAAAGGVPVADALRRVMEWRASMPTANLRDEAVERVIRRSQEDLGSLRIFNPDQPDRAVVAAGAPWFMALFGRDSLLTSFMSLLLDPSLAKGTLLTLAEHQGTKVDAASEEEPGRILHEVRLGATAGLALGGSGVYYGTIDATPLFVIVLAELARWGLDDAAMRQLLPAADRAIRWMEDYGDRDGDGFIEYQRKTERGLRNQGWKDSGDGINFADGTLAEPPIALCEVQGYAYAAYIGRALLATAAGDARTAESCVAKATSLKQAFNEQFWLSDRGYFAIALDKDKKPVDALASNMAHCLWTGIVDNDKAAQVAGHLVSPEMFTGWGIRTLASTMGAYNPASYHNGSVWPHDNAIAAAGLMRHGFVDEARKVAYALLEAADRFNGRLPELFCGLDRARYPEPVPYPASCSPQAWASAAPVQLIRTLLRFDPGLPWDEVWLAPTLPPRNTHFHFDNVPFSGDGRLSIHIDDESVDVSGLPQSIKLRREPRPPLSELFNLGGH